MICKACGCFLSFCRLRLTGTPIFAACVYTYRIDLPLVAHAAIAGASDRSVERSPTSHWSGGLIHTQFSGGLFGSVSNHERAAIATEDVETTRGIHRARDTTCRTVPHSYESVSGGMVSSSSSEPDTNSVSLLRAGESTRAQWWSTSLAI